jgi:hypothetical protein
VSYGERKFSCEEVVRTATWSFKGKNGHSGNDLGADQYMYNKKLVADQTPISLRLALSFFVNRRLRIVIVDNVVS